MNVKHCTVFYSEERPEYVLRWYGGDLFSIRRNHLEIGCFHLMNCKSLREAWEASEDFFNNLDERLESYCGID